MEANINSAIKHGFLQQVRFLIEFGHHINERDDDLRTPLINCAFISDEEWAVGIARLLIEKGATVSLRDKLGLNALHYAALHGRRQLVQLYLNAIDFNVNAIDKYGNTALHYATSTGNVGITKDLINTYKKYGVNINKTNRRGETALIQAWKTGHFECGEVLVKHGGVDEDIRDKVEGLTAREWQQIYFLKTQETNGIKNLTSASYRPVTSASDRSNRQRTVLKRIQVNTTPVSPNRPVSAPSPAFNKRASLAYNSNKENTNEDDPVPPVLRKNKTMVYYRPAHVNDHRNSPQHIFQISPVEYFTNYGRYQASYPFEKEKSDHRSKTKHIPEFGNNNWRCTLKSYLTGFNFQFAHSYRKTAVPPEPEPEMNFDERPESPAVSEVAESDHGKRGGRKDKEKGNKDKNLKNEKSASRRTSTLTVPNNLTSMDSSSSESINMKGLQRRISRMGDDAKVERLKSAKPGTRDGIQSRTSMAKK